MKKILVIITLTFFVPIIFSQNYKVAENYIIQEIVKSNTPIHTPFAPDNYFMFPLFGHYIATERDVLNFIKNDNVDNTKLILFLNEWTPFYLKTNNVLIDGCIVDWANFIDILYLGDTPIYKIGGKMYLLRKIRYAYVDNIEAFAQKNKLHYNDDIDTTEDSDTTLISAKEFFNVTYFQYYLFTIDIMQNHKKLKQSFWKKRYELLNKCFDNDNESNNY
ncbi:MAG: vacuolar protein sorting-associated protein 35 [Paludibacter sp.]|jgi:hypothetical protein|nr:vacuolar protein sorting-associated protein 35 [Paludibacter sp.]